MRADLGWDYCSDALPDPLLMYAFTTQMFMYCLNQYQAMF